jgi:hypothetical protein
LIWTPKEWKLSSLQHVDGDLIIHATNITDLNSLHELTHVSGSLWLEENDLLTSLNGWSLQYVNDIGIVFNNELTDISDINITLTDYYSGIIVENNLKLTNITLATIPVRLYTLELSGPMTTISVPHVTHISVLNINGIRPATSPITINMPSLVIIESSVQFGLFPFSSLANFMATDEQLYQINSLRFWAVTIPHDHSRLHSIVVMFEW